VAWRVHDAQHWGVPQRRRRISVVADFGGDTAGEILFERKSVPGHPAESGAAGERLAGNAESGASYAVRIRGGCDGGGKGALVQTEKSGTLGTGNDQTIFTAIPINDKATRWQGGGESRNHDGSGNGLGIGKEGDPSPTLTAGDRHGVMCLNDQGGNVMGVSHDVSGTLRAQEHGHQPAVMAFDTTQITSKQNGSIPDFGKPCHTLNANAHVPCAVLDMSHACDVIRDCGEVSPSLQARMATGGNQVPLTYQMQGFGDYRKGDVASSCKQRDFKDSTDLVRAVVRTAMIVRRLTPMECERLQGYPDGWTDIGEWMDSKGKRHKDADSPRYKALGNSIALPFWDFLAKRISAQYLRPVTMGSLFDGIGGFPLVFERHNGKGTARWASEIEEFPIAVTKKWFGED
jgi:DNA (cytosine-5)-methyltransferase 1